MEIGIQRRFARAQILYCVAALDNGFRRVVEPFVKHFRRPIALPRKQIARRLENGHQPLKTLQKCVVKITRDARPFFDPPLQAHVEFLLKLPDTEPARLPKAGAQIQPCKQLETTMWPTREEGSAGATQPPAHSTPRDCSIPNAQRVVSRRQ